MISSAIAKKEKQTPLNCVCGCPAVIVKARGRGGKMISCPNPEKCAGNIRTMWHDRLDEAIAEWNVLVTASKAGKTKI